MIHEITVKTGRQTEFVRLTERVQELIEEQGFDSGRCLVFVPHTTAGITINEGADPDVVHDMLKELNKIVPFEDGYLHAEGNSAAHIKASMMGSSITVLVENGRLVLGTWQAIFFCEFDGPRTRKVFARLD